MKKLLIAITLITSLFLTACSTEQEEKVTTDNGIVEIEVKPIEIVEMTIKEDILYENILTEEVIWETIPESLQ